MAGQIQFNRDYAAFGARVEPYEKTEDVGIVVTEFLWYLGAPFYPIGALIGAKISGQWLGEGERPKGDVANLDLIFKMGAGYERLFEIILRSEGTDPSYGGYFYGDSLAVTDEVVNSHRVVIATDGGSQARYEYDPASGQYKPVTLMGSHSTLSVRKSAKSMRLG